MRRIRFIDENTTFDFDINKLRRKYPKLSESINDIFDENGNVAKDPFFEVVLSGDPSTNHTSVIRYRPEGIVVSKKPLANIINYIYEFVSQYNETIQDRNHRVTQYNKVDYGKILLPYIILSVVSGYKSDSLSGISVNYHLGLFSFSFDNKYGIGMNGKTLIEHFKKDDYYKIIVSMLKICDDIDFSHLFSGGQTYTYDECGTFVSIQYFKQYHNEETKLYNRIIMYIEYAGGATRKELSTYFKISDRTINNILLKLINDKKIQRIGNKHSPLVKYIIQK